jgi:hypothetical protein
MGSPISPNARGGAKRQVGPLEASRVGDYVDLDDLPVRERDRINSYLTGAPSPRLQHGRRWELQWAGDRPSTVVGGLASMERRFILVPMTMATAIPKIAMPRGTWIHRVPIR